MAMVKVPNETCDKCGMEIEVPDLDETRPMSAYFPKWERAVLKHAWQCHREEFPQEFKSFTQFMEWLKAPESGRQQNKTVEPWSISRN